MKGYRSNLRIQCRIKRPAFLRRWVFVALRSCGWTLPIGFLVRLEVRP